MLAHLRRLFYIPNIQQDLSQFLRSCLLCKHVKGGKIITRPWSETFRCHERNRALHWDFLYVGKSFGKAKYLLVMKDNATHYCELTICDSPTSSVAVEALLGWHSRFGLPPIWVSDNGTHFKNEVVSEVCRRMKCEQHFTLAYSPWINGSVERVNRDILQVLRIMLLEYKLDTRDWVYLIPLVQASLNHTKVPSLSNLSPSELFTGLPCPSPLNSMFLTDKRTVVPLPEESKELGNYLDQLRDHIRDLHRPLADVKEKQTLLNRRQARGARETNFSEGDYVLRSRVDDKYGDKLLVTWVGPYRVVGVSQHAFRIEHLITGDQVDVHGSRLKFYADEKFEVTEEIREHIAAQGIVLAIEKLLQHRYNDHSKEYEILVAWKGLEAIESSWEPVVSLFRDVRVLVQCYATSCADPSFLAHIQAMGCPNDS
jgi:hypothetical protein